MDSCLGSPIPTRLGIQFGGVTYPQDWLALVRPDNVIPHDGPVEDATRLVREVLFLLPP